MAAVSALIASAAALTFTAALFSRRRRALRPTAIALGATVAIDLARLAADHALRGEATPYAGADGLMFRADVVLFCAWPAPLVALAWHVLPRRRWWPPVAIFAAVGLAMAMAYPTVRGPALVALQGVTRPLALMMAAEALLSVRRRLPVLVALGAALRARTGAGIVAAFAIDMAAQTMGPWLPPWPAPPAWEASRLATAMAHLLIAIALAAEWRKGRRGRAVR